MIYTDNREHLMDELRRLDLLIHLEVLKQKSGRPDNPLEQFKGLVLTDEEIAGLLTEAAGPQSGNGPAAPGEAELQQINEELNRLTSQIRTRREASLKEGVYLSLPHLSELFNLTPFEERCILITLAPEVERRYEKFYAYLQDDITRKKPGVDLVLKLLCPSMQEKLAARSAFAPQAPLLKFGLVEMTGCAPEDFTPLLSRFIKLNDRIVNFLLGSAGLDPQLENAARVVTTGRGPACNISPDQVRDRVREFIQAYFNGPGPVREGLVLYFTGPYGAGKKLTAETACRDLAIPLIISDVRKMLTGRAPFGEQLRVLGRETVLQQAALCLDNFDCLFDETDKNGTNLLTAIEIIHTFSRITFLLGRQPWKPQGLTNGTVFIEIKFPVPGDKARKKLWAELGGAYQLDSGIDPGDLAGKFRFTPGQIRDALAAAKNQAYWRSPEKAKISMTDLHAACRAQSNLELGGLARKITPGYTWDDIILPADQIEQLREICSQVKYRPVVYGEWGFDRKLPYGKGLNILFSGPPGTGKTMAAEVIANELQLDLYKIDLSQVVSKYIGETEKNLQRIFQAAEASNAILFFDEADALFGKRSEVKDAHDRYANIEIAYLLQKMEEYDGITILATNLRNNMDDAFMRRMQFTVDFPFPEEDYRRRIWEVIFPDGAPLDTGVDFSGIAREVRLAGGNIKNIALAAAFHAAADGGPVRMEHLIKAARREFQKLGRSWTGTWSGGKVDDT